MKLRLEIGLQLFSSSLGRVAFLKTGLICVHLNSSGNKPERSDTFMMSVIGLIRRQGMLSVVRSEVGQDHSIYLVTT